MVESCIQSTQSARCAKCYFPDCTELRLSETYESHEELRKAVLRKSGLDKLFVDKSRSEGATICWGTREPYVRPYILNLNGRSYSKEWITAAITDALLTRRSELHLEDTCIHFTQVDDIVLYQNKSLSGWGYAEECLHPQTLVFNNGSGTIEYPAYNHEEMMRRNIPDISRHFDAILPLTAVGSDEASDDDDDNTTDAGCVVALPAVLLKCYKTARSGDATTVSPSFRDLCIENIVFPRAFMKLKRAMSFSNVHFVDCVINLGALERCVRFYGCQFTNCYFVVGYDANSIRTGNFSCSYIGCKWFYPFKQDTMPIVSNARGYEHANLLAQVLSNTNIDMARGYERHTNLFTRIANNIDAGIAPDYEQHPKWVAQAANNICIRGLMRAERRVISRSVNFAFRSADATEIAQRLDIAAGVAAMMDEFSDTFVNCKRFDGKNGWINL